MAAGSPLAGCGRLPELSVIEVDETFLVRPVVEGHVEARPPSAWRGPRPTAEGRERTIKPLRLGVTQAFGWTTPDVDSRVKEGRDTARQEQHVQNGRLGRWQGARLVRWVAPTRSAADGELPVPERRLEGQLCLPLIAGSWLRHRPLRSASRVARDADVGRAARPLAAPSRDAERRLEQPLTRSAWDPERRASAGLSRPGTPGGRREGHGVSHWQGRIQGWEQ